MDSVQTFFSSNRNTNNLGAMMVLLVSFILVIYVAMYLYKQFVTTSLKTLTMVKDTPLKITGNSMHNLSENDSIPTQSNGKEFSMSVWMYVDNSDMESTTTPKFVLARASSAGAVANGQPVFYMDPQKNSLNVAIRENSSMISGSLTAVHNSSSLRKLTIDYLPMQRWVNVILVIDQNYVQLFMDGELRQVDDLSTSTRTRVVDDSSGDIYAGGSSNITSFKGFLSKVQWFNYAVTIDHAKLIYAAGPLRKTLLSSVGLPLYGIRSPFVRIDGTESNECPETSA
jgi:hypothetical protein